MPPSSSRFEFDGIVRFTNVGIGYLVLTLLIGFAALNTGNNSLYLTLAFMLGTLLISGIASKGGLKHLTIVVDPLTEVWAGRVAHGEIEIRNSSPLWNIRDLIVTSPDLEVALVVPLIRRRETVRLDVPFLFQRRGAVNLKSIDLYTRYPFGFFLKKRRLRASGLAIVYPRLLERSVLHQLSLRSEGEAASGQRPGSGIEIHGFREYVRGDSLRLVHWKKSASIGRWIVKQPEMEAERIVRIALDPFHPPAATDEEYESMVSAAATYLHEAAAHEAEVTFRLPEKMLQGSGASTAQSIYHELALLEPTQAPWMESFEPGTAVFRIGSGIEARTA